MKINEIKNRLKNMSLLKDCIATHHLFTSKLDDLNRVLERENELRKLAGDEFVEAFRYTAQSISETLPDSNTESYCRLADSAIEVLAQGNDPAEVLWYFDMKLARMKGGVK